MKRQFRIITSGCAASLMAFTALAQEAPNAKTGGTEIVPERSSPARSAERLGRAEKTSDLIGMEVKNYQGEKLGKVDELAVDLNTGRIVQVILSTGGFLGLAVMLVPVPPGALHYDVANKVIHLQADKEKLKAAPWFGISKWDELGYSNQVVEAYRYFDQIPYFAAIYPPALGPDPTARLAHVQRATQLMGVSVKNVQNETLGKVEHLMVDLPAGRLVTVILSSGEFLGMGRELSAVPPAAFQVTSEHAYLQLDVSREALSKAPHFPANEWPDLGDPTYAVGIYRAYRVEPYFTADSLTN